MAQINQKFNILGWGLVFGIIPCWIIEDKEQYPSPYGPMTMGWFPFSFISEILLGIIMFIYNIFLGIYNKYFNKGEDIIEPMFVIWLSPRTKQTLIDKYGRAE